MSIHTPKTIRVVAVLCASGLVLASAGFGALYAYKVGVQHSILLAGLSILMAVALEGVKPLAIAAGLQGFKTGGSKGASAALIILGGISVAYSLTAELSLISMSKGDLIAEREAQSTSASDARRDRQRIEAELAAIGIARPAQAIQADIDGLLTDTRLKGCTSPLSNWRLQAICTDKVSPLRVELATAERREKLEGQLSNRHTIAPSKVSDPGSVALATYLAALGFTVPASIIGQWLILVPVLALEIGSALAYVLVQSLPATPGNDSVKIDGLPVVSGPVVQPENTGPEATREKVKRAVVDHLKANDGKASGGERGLAKLIGSSRGTMKRALQGLVAAGIVSLEASRNGTILRLVS